MTGRTEGRGLGVRARLLALLLPCILGLLALDSWNDYRGLRDVVQGSYDRLMLDTAEALGRGVSLAPDGSARLDAGAVDAQRRFEAGAESGGRVHVAAASSGTAARTLAGDATLPPPPAGAGDGPVWYDADDHGRPLRVVALRRTLADAQGRPVDVLVQAAEGVGPRERAEAASLRQQILRDVRMVLVVVLLVWLGVTWSLRPLERLRRSVILRQGQRPEPLDPGGVPHEVAPLVDAVNRNVASYRQLLDRQSQFLADASHQLRTPLAILMTQAGVALRENDTAQLHDTLRAMVTQIARSRRLCEQLLSLAHATDDAAPTPSRSLTDLNAVTKEVALQYLTLAHDKDQDLGWVDARDASPQRADGSPAVPVHADAAELHEVLANLVHNAIVHTPRGGRITVKAGIDGDTAWAEVSDDGPGIAPARRTEVFERFRHEGDRAGDGARGAGLGLAIARAYAQRNGGEIVLDDAEASTEATAALPGRPGLRAALRLPLAAPHHP